MLAALLVGGAGTSPVAADDPPPIVPPPGVTAPPAPTGSTTPGPTYVITPGVGGSELGAPADQKSVDEARKADHRATQRPASTATGSPGSPAPRTGAQSEYVTGPQTPLAVDLDHVDRVGILWRGFAAAVMALVLIEISIVRGYLRRRSVRARSA